MAPYGPFITWALRALENVRGPIPTGLCSENEPKASSDRVHPAPAGRGSTLSTAVMVGSLFAFPLNIEKNCAREMATDPFWFDIFCTDTTF